MSIGFYGATIQFDASWYAARWHNAIWYTANWYDVSWYDAIDHSELAKVLQK